MLEAGCGVGAQTRELASRHPQARFVRIDLSAGSLDEAEAAGGAAKLATVTFLVADIFALPFSEAGVRRMSSSASCSSTSPTLAALCDLRRALPAGRR